MKSYLLLASGLCLSLLMAAEPPANCAVASGYNPDTGSGGRKPYEGETPVPSRQVVVAFRTRELTPYQVIDSSLYRTLPSPEQANTAAAPVALPEAPALGRRTGARASEYRSPASPDGDGNQR